MLFVLMQGGRERETAKKMRLFEIIQLEIPHIPIGLVARRTTKLL